MMKTLGVSMTVVLLIIHYTLLPLKATAADKMLIHYKNGKTTTMQRDAVERIEFQGRGGFSYTLSGKTVDIIAKHSGNSLDVSGASKGDEANIYQWDCHGGDNKLWKLR